MLPPVLSQLRHSPLQALVVMRMLMLCHRSAAAACAHAVATAADAAVSYGDDDRGCEGFESRPVK